MSAHRFLFTLACLCPAWLQAEPVGIEDLLDAKDPIRSIHGAGGHRSQLGQGTEPVTFYSFRFKVKSIGDPDFDGGAPAGDDTDDLMKRLERRFRKDGFDPIAGGFEDPALRDSLLSALRALVEKITSDPDFPIPGGGTGPGGRRISFLTLVWTPDNGIGDQLPPASIPEAGTLILLGLAFAGSIPGIRRLRRTA